MIKLVFNRFDDATNVIKMELITEAKSVGLNTVTNETKNYRDTVYDTKAALEALGKTGFAINTSSISSTVKQLEYLQKLLKVVKDSPGTNIKGGIATLDKYGLFDTLPSGAKKLLGNLGDIQGASKADSNYASLQGTLTSVGSILKSLNTEIDNIDKNTEETIDDAQKKINELAGTINTKLLNAPPDMKASSLMTGYQLWSGNTGKGYTPFDGDKANFGMKQSLGIPTVVNPDKIKQSSDLMKELNSHTQETVSTLYNGFNKTDDEVEKTNGSFKEFLNNLKKAPSLVDALSKGFNSLNIVKLTYLFRAVKRVTSTMVSMVENAADYEESLNLYTMALGVYVDKATDWSNRITDALKLDPAEVMKYTGALYNLTKGLGVSSDAAYIMGTNLTQLTYDMASYLNISNEAAFAKIQSAMAGQSRAVATVGVATQMASLQELALDLGIKKKVKDMTQAEKTYLRYIQLMKNTTQMQGDLGRTMITPANAIRTLKNQINLLSRSIGQVMTPIIMKAIPYIMALTNVLTEAAKKLAEFFGYKIADVDYSSSFAFEDADEGAENLNKLGDAAAGAAKKVNNSLAPFDDLNQVMSENSGSGSGGSGSGTTIDGSVWDKLLPEYDMLKDYTGELVDKAKELEDVVTKIGVAIAVALGVVKIADWIKKISDLKNALNNLGITSSSILGRFFIGAAGVGSIAIGNTIFDFLIEDAKNAESEVATKGEKIGVAIGELAYTVGGALAGFAVGGPVGAVAGAAIGMLGGIVTLFQKAADEMKLIELGIPKIEKTTEKIHDYNVELSNLMGPLDDNIESTKKAYEQYGYFAERLDQIVDSTGKVKEGHEAEAKTIVNKLNVGLGMHIKLQDGEIKNYQNIQTEIQKTIKTKEREATVNAYAKKYEAILGELLTTTDTYGESVKNLNDAQIAMSKEATDETVKAYQKAKTEYDNNKKEYFNMLADKMRYEALYKATLSNDTAEIDRIMHDSTLTQEYWVKQALVQMTNEAQGPLSDGVIQAWKDLAYDSSEEFNKGIKEIGNEDAKKQIYESMNIIYDAEKEHAKTKGTEVGEEYTDSVQDTINGNPVALRWMDDEGREFAQDVYGNVTAVFRDPIDVSLKEENSTWKNMRTRLKNYFANNPVTLSGELSWASSLASKAGDKIRAALNFKANGGFVDSGDLFFANENGRSEFITHVGGHAAVANQDQMIQALSNAIMAGFSMYNGGKSGSTTVYIGNDKVYEGQGRYQSRQTDRYGTSVINV